MEHKQAFLSAEECDHLASLMERKYGNSLMQRSFSIAVRQDSRGVYATVTLQNQSGSFYYPVEGRVADLDHDMAPRDAVLFLLDYIDAYFDEFFQENGEVYLPIDWAEYEADGVPLQLKGQILNLEAERLADRLLGTSGEEAQSLH